MSTALDQMAERVKADSWFLAHPLAEYARSAGLDDAALAARLGCAPVDLTAVRLCRTPRTEPDEFRADLTAVAERFGLNLVELAAAVRHGRGVAHVREAAAEGAETGWTVAARDRQPPE
jgi:hypothetical protein